MSTVETLDIEQIHQMIKDQELVLKDAWADELEKDVARKQIDELRGYLEDWELKPGDQVIHMESGELLQINSQGYAEAYGGKVVIEPDLVREKCKPYTNPEAQKAFLAGSESNASQTSTPAAAGQEQQSRVDVYHYAELEKIPRSFATYIVNKYSGKSLSDAELIEKLSELWENIADHPMLSVLLEEITLDAVEGCGEIERTCTEQLARYKAQYEARKKKAAGTLAFIKEDILPKLSAWAEAELKRNKSKARFIDTASVRLQLQKTGGEYVKEEQHIPTGAYVHHCFETQKQAAQKDAFPFGVPESLPAYLGDAKLYSDWFVGVEVQYNVNIDWKAAKVKAAGILEQAQALSRDKKYDEAKALLATIPPWLQYKDVETTGYFTVAKESKKK